MVRCEVAFYGARELDIWTSAITDTILEYEMSFCIPRTSDLDAHAA
jgi:hypothetical protein